MEGKPIGNKQANKKKGLSRNLGYDIIFWALNCIAVPLSAYQTYYGYIEMLDGEIGAIAVAALSGILFFALNMLIRDRRLKGKGTLVLLLGYIVPLSLSFFGFFNTTYCSLVKKKYFFDELEHYQEVINDNHTFALNVLESEMLPCENAIEDIETAMFNVFEEFRGESGRRASAGCGSKCNTNLDTLMMKIEGITGNRKFDNAYANEEIVKLRRKGRSMNSRDIKYYEDLLTKEVGTITKKYEARERKRLNYDRREDKIDSFFFQADISGIDSLQVESQMNASHAIFFLNNLKTMNNNIVNEVVGLGGYSESDLEAKKIVDVDAISFKNPGWTVNHVISMQFPGWVIASFLFALVIDLAALLFIYLAYDKKKPSFLEF